MVNGFSFTTHHSPLTIHHSALTIPVSSLEPLPSKNDPSLGLRPSSPSVFAEEEEFYTVLHHLFMSSAPRRFAARAGITLVLLMLPVGSAFSADRDVVATNVPQCRGVVSQEILDAVLTATKDPRRALEKQRRRGTIRMSRASIDRASRLWRALHPPKPGPSVPISEGGRRRVSRGGVGEQNGSPLRLPYRGAHGDGR